MLKVHSDIYLDRFSLRELDVLSRGSIGSFTIFPALCEENSAVHIRNCRTRSEFYTLLSGKVVKHIESKLVVLTQ